MAEAYPTNGVEWREAIAMGLSLTAVQVQAAYDEKWFPYQRLDQWIITTYSQGFSPQFVPALRRNVQGLVAWAYGEGDEPYWPSADSTAPELW